MVAGRKRYWSFNEVYRRYSHHLRRQYSVYNLQERGKALVALRDYFGWLKKEALTLYTALEAELRSYFQWLVSPTNPDTRHHVEETLQRRKSCLYHFYEWLLEQGYVEENPFTESLYEEVTRLIRSRDAPPEENPRREVPASYKEVYALARKMESLRGYHETTVYLHERAWRNFFDWLESVGVLTIEQTREKELLDYQEYLLQKEDEKTGYRFSAITRLRHLTAVKALFEYLRLALRVQHDPTHVIELPKVGKGIPHVLMSRHEVEKLLALPDVATSMGIRDRAIMEVFYSSGLRLNELCHLKEEDLLFQEGMVRVMVPKGGPSKQRVVAIGRTALEWVRRYLDEARPLLVGKNKSETLFINSEGGSLQKQNLVNVMRNYRLKAGFKKQITSHSFRVTCATEMLRNRADIRYVQAQLGHSAIQSTQIYARVLPTDLKKVHQRTHPRERRCSSVIARADGPQQSQP